MFITASTTGASKCGDGLPLPPGGTKPSVTKKDTTSLGKYQNILRSPVPALTVLILTSCKSPREVPITSCNIASTVYTRGLNGVFSKRGT